MQVICHAMMPFLWMALVTASMLICSRNHVHASSLIQTECCLTADNAPGTDESSLEKELTELLKLTNEERKKAGVPALTVNSTLEAAAKLHSRNMAKQEKMEHELDGKGPSDRVKELEYKFRALAENIAERQKAPAEAIKSWMDSEDHRTNLLNKDYTEIGLGVAESAQGVRYWTQVFGKPRE